MNYLKSAFGIGFLGAGLMGCGSAAVSSVSAGPSKPQSTKPSKVLAVPSGVVGASSPLPNGTLWVLAGNVASKGIFQVELSGGKIVASISVSNNASAIAQSQTGEIGIGIATPQGGGALEFHSGVTGSLVSTVPLSGPVVALCAGSDGKTFFALTKVGSGTSVSIVDDSTGKVISTVPSPASSISIAVTPSERHVYVVQDTGIVMEVSTSNGQIDGQFSVGHSAHFVAISNDGSSLYVLKGQDLVRNVAVVDVAREAVTKVLPAASSSVGLALSPDDSTLYDIVGNAAYGNIQVFGLA